MGYAINYVNVLNKAPYKINIGFLFYTPTFISMYNPKVLRVSVKMGNTFINGQIVKTIQKTT